MFRLLTASSLLVLSMNSFAETTTTEWDVGRDNISSSLAGNDSSRSNDYTWVRFYDAATDVEMTITGWSDSKPTGDSETTDTSPTNKLEYDQTVEQGVLYSWSYDEGNWGVVNGDENADTNKEHAIDNYSGAGHFWSDQDMVLLSFSREVSLDSIQVSWVQDGANDVLDIATVSIDDDAVADMASESKAWADIYDSSDLIQLVKDTTDSAYYNLASSGGMAKHWLVGLYTEALQCDYDAFKLSGVVTSRTTTTTNVSEPSTLALFLLAAAFIYRRQSANKQQKFKLSC